MSSPWYFSWFPNLPLRDFVLPSRLQGRFISFALKKSLGHFLKPGQLDSHQIDSQIGSGYVQINDLELDNQAINTLIDDLPIRLHDGSITSVTARVPLPNPLTSNVGLALNGLHLTFHVVPLPAHAPKPAPDLETSISSLAESMVSVAESFVHDELNSTQETAQLWQSFHSSAHPPNPDDDHVPGGLDPFVSAPEEEVQSADTDPAGVSLFASLIERLLAKFEFDATNTKVTLVHPDNTRITISLEEIKYRTEDKSKESGHKAGETRTVSFSGLQVGMCDLRPTLLPHLLLQPAPSSPATPQAAVGSSTLFQQETSKPPSVPASPSSSVSSLDEETHLAMSQSLAFLPPRPVSPSSSVSSSMYQSALSATPMLEERQSSTEIPEESEHQESSAVTPEPILPPELPKQESESGLESESPKSSEKGELILSFGAIPILVQVTTPPPQPGPVKASGPSTQLRSLANENIHVTVTTSIITGFLRPWHLSALSVLAADFGSSPTPSVSARPKSSASSSPLLKMGVQVECNIRGVVLLFLPNLSHGDEQSHLLQAFFSHPLVPPKLPHMYFRLHLESLHFSLQKASQSIKPTSTGHERHGGTSTPGSLSFTFSINDTSLFSIDSAGSDEMTALPLILTDHLLPSQYPKYHTHVPREMMNDSYTQLPVFEIVDWTDKKYSQNGMKLSTWRTRPPKHRATKNTQSLPKDTGADEEHMSSQQGPVVLVKGSQRSSRGQRHRHSSEAMDMEIKVVPLHVYADLGTLIQNPIISGFSEALSAGSARPSRSDPSQLDVNVSDDEDMTPPTTPRSRKDLEREKERKRLERMVLEDLDLEFDYLQKKNTQQSGRKRKKQPAPRIKLSLAMIRLEVRTPSPAKYGGITRSGSLVLDLHELQFTNGPSSTAPRARIADDDSQTPHHTHSSTLASVQVKRIIIATSLSGRSSATAFISLGSLQEYSDELSPSLEQTKDPLQPRVSISKAQPHSKSLIGSLITAVDIPSLHCHITKELADALQYWADDVAQLLESTSKVDDANDGTDTEIMGDGSLIGSNFFVKTRSGSVNSIQSGPSEMIVKISVSEAFVRVMLPSATEVTRPFDVLASDVDVLLELAPEGKDETIITTSVMDFGVRLANSQGFETLLALTTPRSMSTEAQSLLKVRFASLPVPGSTGKETRLRVTLWGFTCNVPSELVWVTELQAFAKSPPGTFETVIPNERTSIILRVVNGSIRAYAPRHPGAMVLHVGDCQFSTEVVGESTDTSFQLAIPSVSLLAIDDVAHQAGSEGRLPYVGAAFWKKSGYALLAELADTELIFASTANPKHTDVTIGKIGLRLHLCADSLTVVTALVGDLTSGHKPPQEKRQPPPKTEPRMVSRKFNDTMLASIEDMAFKQEALEIGPTADMIFDDLPTNMNYLDESFGTAGGLRELTDDDLDEFEDDGALAPHVTDPKVGTVNMVGGGETIKMFTQEVKVEEYYFDHIPTEAANQSARRKGAEFSLTAQNADITLLLYDGYDWLKTRKVIEEEVKEMRRRLAKIRQLVASGQTQDPTVEDTSALLFNSVHIGLRQDPDTLEPNALLAAIDDELKEDLETATQSSWQSLRQPTTGRLHQPRSIKVHGKRLNRSKGPSIEFRLAGLNAEFDQYNSDSPLVSRTLVTIRDVEILDHIKTSTWKKFLTELRSDAHGNIRETGSNMVRVELLSVHPVPDHPSEEARLRAKLLPLRLYVDQDALDFLKKFFSFKDPNSQPETDGSSDDGDIYFQLAEVFPVDLKLDYKPRRVDYRALREGRTIELMNFFHFDGAEMTLRHITLSGIKGWPKFFDLLNDLWTPDVKATQLVDVISGVAPIRSVVNVGSGVADLVLLPIAQYKKDGRIVRGVQKGTTAFVKSTAIEAIKLGARLATGTQVILEQAEGVLGGQFNQPVTTETMAIPTFDDGFDDGSDGDAGPDEMADMISKYAQQPTDIKEGVQHAYKSLRKNLNSAAQTILAVPMEVYERSGSEGAIRSVIRAVPIAVLKPMIGASEAVSKTLLGLHNSLDPNLRHDNEAKYKHG
ncbi:hypothetical protein AX16_003652 [Volvariella volvacea WC 439]|nr:hypothetical protein AX16_003652 [Volvariella volvacea WC 439]